MILAEEVVAAAALFLADAVAGVQTGVAQRMNAVGRLAHQHDRAAAHFGAEIIAIAGEPADMVDRQPGTREELRDFGGEHRIGVEQLHGGRYLTARLDLLAQGLDAVGKLHHPVPARRFAPLPL